MQVALKRRIQTDWAFASLDELKERRTAALAEATAAEGNAVEPRRQSEMYMKAAAELGGRATALEAYAKAGVATDHHEEARQNFMRAAELRGLSDKNWLLADQKARIAAIYEGRAHQALSLARRLEVEIKSRTGSFEG